MVYNQIAAAGCKGLRPRSGLRIASAQTTLPLVDCAERSRQFGAQEVDKSAKLEMNRTFEDVIHLGGL